MQFLGASDTAGYCVDGTTEDGPIQNGPFGWKNEDCANGYVSDLAKAFQADLEVIAIAGIGLTQNANSAQTWQMGKLTLPDFYNRTL